MSKTFDLERVLVGLALVVIFFTAIFDYMEDISLGAATMDMVVDTLVNVFIVGTFIYIWCKRPRATQSHNNHLEQVLERSDKDLQAWKEKASELLRGLGKKIDEQLDEWDLSQAEKEVALLLIKGLSTKELSSCRGTSEKTVRQQASQIYAKANLNNRAELAAFFLEDLLLP